MSRKLGLAISYFVAIIYVFSILLPCLYCFQHGCRGPGELDAFMPAFALHSVWSNRYSFRVAQRRTTHQKRTIMVLGFLAACNYFRDCSARCDCSYRNLHLLLCISSLRASCQHLPSLLSNRKKLPVAQVAGYAERS